MIQHPKAFQTSKMRYLLFLLLIVTNYLTQAEIIPTDSGETNYHKANIHFQQGRYEEAAEHYWAAVLLHSTNPSSHIGGKASYAVQDAFVPFIKCYSIRDKLADGTAYIAMESWKRGQLDMAQLYVDQTLIHDANHEEALLIKELLESGIPPNQDVLEMYLNERGMNKNKHKKGSNGSPPQLGNNASGNKNSAMGGFLTPEAHKKYEIGSDYFIKKQFALSAQAFEESCTLTGERLGVACTNAAYCRSNILQWGDKGEQFTQDMERIVDITKKEVEEYRTELPHGAFKWSKSTSVHPHMMLAYPIDSMLKRYVAESFAEMDEKTARIDPTGTKLVELPPDLPYDPKEKISDYIFQYRSLSHFKIRVAFVACGFNSKAVLYLSHDMFRFFNRSKFEVHVFSLGAPDNDNFINVAMRGVDWRQRVKDHVHTFHDVRHLKNSHIELARYIRAQDIHILIEWDGYARQGERAQGLFALRPAPIQVLHQEFLGTSGAQYVDYIVTDKMTSPMNLQHLYTEAFMYMPNHFFSKGHAMQAEVKSPTYDYGMRITMTSIPQVQMPQQTHVLGTGTPQENRCLSSEDVGPTDVSFVFCNFNKFLKNNPETVQSWMNILRSVPDSLLCLLENPREGIPNLRAYIHDMARDRHDGDDLNSRIHFLPWEANPFDHQMRNQDFCNLVLDSHPYNGHTTAQDALYGGVPIVTRSDGDDMSSRVSTSANIVLGLEDLNAYAGVEEYERIAIKLGTDEDYYDKVRTKLIDSCVQKNPMHPYWDVPRYVRNFQSGLLIAWERYLDGTDVVYGSSGVKKKHIEIIEDATTRKGTYEDDLVRWNEMNEKMIQVKKSREQQRGRYGEL